MTQVPRFRGLHHVTFAVRSLDAGLEFFGTAFGARRDPDLDHVDESGALVAVVLTVPGVAVPVQLLLAADGTWLGAEAVSFQLASYQDLEDLAAHWDAAGLDRTAISRRLSGCAASVTTPDGGRVRVYAPFPG